MGIIFSVFSIIPVVDTYLIVFKRKTVKMSEKEKKSEKIVYSSHKRSLI